MVSERSRRDRHVHSLTGVSHSLASRVWAWESEWLGSRAYGLGVGTVQYTDTAVRHTGPCRSIQFSVRTVWVVSIGTETGRIQ